MVIEVGRLVMRSVGLPLCVSAGKLLNSVCHIIGRLAVMSVGFYLRSVGLFGPFIFSSVNFPIPCQLLVQSFG